MKWNDLTLKERKRIYDSVKSNNPNITYLELKEQFDNIPAYYNVKLSKIMEPLKLTLLNKEVDVDKVELHQSDVNRPALQLAGFFEHFD